MTASHFEYLIELLMAFLLWTHLGLHAEHVKSTQEKVCSTRLKQALKRKAMLRLALQYWSKFTPEAPSIIICWGVIRPRSQCSERICQNGCTEVKLTGLHQEFGWVRGGSSFHRLLSGERTIWQGSPVSTAPIVEFSWWRGGEDLRRYQAGRQWKNGKLTMHEAFQN